jgi:hypothetical protein
LGTALPAKLCLAILINFAIAKQSFASKWVPKLDGLLPKYILNCICALPDGRATILGRRFKSSQPSENSLYW